jgi:transcription-repair coupling factor (superfamily II helicase)
LRLYAELDEIETEEGILAFQQQLIDRFGKMPSIVKELFEGLRMRWNCRIIGIDRVILKNNKLRCFFLQNAQSIFYESEFFKNFLAFMATEGKSHGLILKQTGANLILVKENVRSLSEARSTLQKITEAVDRVPVQIPTESEAV